MFEISKDNIRSFGIKHQSIKIILLFLKGNLMKNFSFILIVVFFLASCASTQPIDTNRCIALANTVKNNEVQSGHNTYQQCIDKQQQKNDAKKAFGKNRQKVSYFF